MGRPAWSPDGRRTWRTFARARGRWTSGCSISGCATGRPHARRLSDAAGARGARPGRPTAGRSSFYALRSRTYLGDVIVGVWIVVPGSSPRARSPRRTTVPSPLRASRRRRRPRRGRPDGRTLLVPVADSGCVHVGARLGRGWQVAPVVGGAGQIQASPSARTGSRLPRRTGRRPRTSTLRPRRHPRTPPHAVSTTPGCPRSRCLGRTSGVRRPARRDARRLGRLSRPIGRRPAPLLVEIHGGPHSSHGNAFPGGALHMFLLASRGWAVLALNPTGSGSFGKAFQVRHFGRWGEFDLPEQLAAVDALVGEGLADPARLAVSGYSYGGFMAAWTTSHSDRFKAAIVGAPIVNAESFYGTSDIGRGSCRAEAGGDLVGHREFSGGSRRSSMSSA